MSFLCVLLLLIEVASIYVWSPVGERQRLVGQNGTLFCSPFQHTAVKREGDPGRQLTNSRVQHLAVDGVR